VINFDWDGRSPAKGISGTDFSARWTGQFRAPVTGAYTFYIDPAGAASVWINGRLLIDGPTSSTGAIKLRAAHRYDLQVDYLQTGGAPARLLWSAPGISQQVVPTTYLFPSALPQAPTSLTAQPLSTSRIQLAWVDRSGKEMGFKVFRASNGGALQRIATLAPNTTSFTDSGLIESTDYTYQVIAYNDSGSSAPAGPTTATTNAAAAPAPASDVKTSVFSAARIDLSWADNAANETGYVVERSLDGNTYQPRATLAANATAYTDAGLQPDTHYYYRVKAENGAGFTLSATADAKTKLNATVDGNGWTTIVPSSDSRIIYVSSSTGNDANSGLFENAPVKTLAKGYSLLRNGMPDQMLLKRGDAFEGILGGEYGTWEKGGRAPTELLVVGGYGTGARPIIHSNTTALNCINGQIGKNLALIGIELHAWQRDPLSPGFDIEATKSAITGVRWLAAGNLLIEDCYIHSFGTNIVVQKYEASITNLSIRRSIIADAYSASAAHSQGAFISAVNGVLIEGNTFDHNGWNQAVAGGDATMFNHNVYMAVGSTGVIVRDNIFSNASSHGLQARSGGEIVGNLFLDNPIHLSVGNGDIPVPSGVLAKIENNVFSGSRTLSGMPRGYGVDIQNLNPNGQSTCSNNLFIGDSDSVAPAILLKPADVNYPSVGINNLTIANNVVYGWATNLSVVASLVPGAVGRYALNGLTVSGNDFQSALGSPIVDHGPASLSQTVFRDNHYYSSADSSSWFRLGGSAVSFAAWHADIDTLGAAMSVTYVDATRSVASYNASGGGEASVAAFLQLARRQNSAEWDPKYAADSCIRYIRIGFNF
jgi:hypothetical protein